MAGLDQHAGASRRQSPAAGATMVRCKHLVEKISFGPDESPESKKTHRISIGYEFVDKFDVCGKL
jgi:hypothetical protein